MAHFFTINSAYCEEDFFIEGNFTESKNKIKLPTQNVAKAIENNKKNGLLSKNKKKGKFNYQTNKTEVTPDGYYGTLPDIEADFEYKKQFMPSTPQIDMVIPEEEVNEENFK